MCFYFFYSWARTNNTLSNNSKFIIDFAFVECKTQPNFGTRFSEIERVKTNGNMNELTNTNN